jgi:hypothetical protein
MFVRMTPHARFGICSKLCGLVALVAWFPAAWAAEPYAHPTIAIPYAVTKPVIDGVVDDAEWQGAFSQRALQTTNRQISARQARFWVMWDEENFYVAMRDRLRQGERPIQALRGRERGKDLDVIFDDCYEIWVSVGATDTLTGQPGCSTSFVGNIAGARQDAIHQPAVGNSRTSSYDTDWEPVSRLTKDNVWEMEVVIPRKSLGTTARPFHDGMRMRALIARNYKRPWEQCSFEGTSTFAVIDSHSEFVLSKTAPALHLLGVGDAATGKLGVQLAALGQTDTTIRWRFASDAVTKDGTAAVRKGVLAEVVNLPDLDSAGDGQVRITVTGADGQPLLDWAARREFGLVTKWEAPAPGEKKVKVQYSPAADVLTDRGDVLDLRTTFNPERDYIRVFGDFINYDNRAAIRAVVIAVADEQGKEVARATAAVDADAYAKAVLPLPNIAPGKYAVKIECRDQGGAVLAEKATTVTKEDPAAKYDWWKTKRASIEKVIAPWTPVTRKANTFGVWGREMEVGAAGLPARITTQGKEILAAAGTLVATTADGK